MRNKKIVSVSVSQNFAIFLHSCNNNRTTRARMPSPASMRRLNCVIREQVSAGRMTAVVEKGITTAEFVS